MVLIREFYIKEFRGIRETKEPIHLSQFNVLISKNNSGKSCYFRSIIAFSCTIS